MTHCRRLAWADCSPGTGRPRLPQALSSAPLISRQLAAALLPLGPTCTACSEAPRAPLLSQATRPQHPLPPPKGQGDSASLLPSPSFFVFSIQTNWKYLFTNETFFKCAVRQAFGIELCRHHHHESENIFSLKETCPASLIPSGVPSPPAPTPQHSSPSCSGRFITGSRTMRPVGVSGLPPAWCLHCAGSPQAERPRLTSPSLH